MELGRVPSSTEKGNDRKKPLRSTLNPSPLSFLACFFFLFLSFFVSSKPVTFLFLRFLPIISLLCTTWNLAKFHTFLSVFLSPHSDRPLIRSDEALWRNVIFSRKKFEKSQPGLPSLLDRRSQKSRSSLIEPPRDLEGSFIFLCQTLGISSALSFFRKMLS